MFETLESRRLCSTSPVSITDIASAGNLGQYTSIAVNPVTKEPAISYYDVTHHDLKFIEFNGKNWIGSTIDSPGNVGRNSSLAFDAQGKAWVAYYDATTHALKLAVGNGLTWSVRNLQSKHVDDAQISLALTKAGLPVIAFVGRDNGGTGLQVATDTSTGWTFSSVDVDATSPPDVAGEYCSLALDSDDLPHVSYESAEADANYASYDGHTWTTQTVDEDAFVAAGLNTHLVLDSAGHPYFTFGETSDTGSPGGVFLASETGSAWTIQNIPAAFEVGGIDDRTATSVVLSSSGSPIVAFWDYSVNDLDISTEKGGVFTDTLVDPSKEVGGYLSMTSDGQGDELISYYNATRGDLEFATVG